MAFIDLDKAVVCSLLFLLCLHTTTGMSGWGGCLESQDVFAEIRENSLPGEVVTELIADTTVEGVHWSLGGKDADWFFLDERSIRLNLSHDKVLDREVQGPVLMVELSCYEEDVVQSVFRIMVEILNENDNTPVFADDTAVSLIMTELTPVNTVVFTVKATDADDDKLIYSIDQTSPDAEYFKVDLPNSGQVVLSKPLDYETKTQLKVTIHASEMDTVEHFNTSVDITVTVVDGDDQYPQFQPCVLLFQDENSRVCTSPTYTVNITEGEEDIVLNFHPGPIHAVDGDRGIDSPISYAILSGDDEGRFLLDRETGEVKLLQGVKDRLTTPAFHLQVMAYQDDDPRKYSVAAVLVRVLAVNQFSPEFNMAEYRGFVIAGKNPASLVSTYGSKVLMLHVQDRDFNHGSNPLIHFTFSPTSNHTDIYQITPEGLLISRTDQLKPKQRHVLQVMATDQESGEAIFTTVVVEVLPEGQPIPYSPLGEDRITGCTMGKAFFLSMVLMTALGGFVSLVMWLKKKHKGKRDPLQRGCVAQGKHPNVSLRWFQLMSHRNAMPHMEEVPYNNEEFGTYNPSFNFVDKPAVYTHQDLPASRAPVAPRTADEPLIRMVPTEPLHIPLVIANNVTAPPKKCSSSPSLHSATMDVSSTDPTQDVSPPKENPHPPHPKTPDITETLPDTRPDSEICSTSVTPSSITPEPQTTKPNPSSDPAVSPSSQSSIPCSSGRFASAEIDKPFCKPRVKTPPHSPFTKTSPLPRQMATAPDSPDHAPLKAKLVHIDASPIQTPLATPEPLSFPTNAEADQPSTSLEQTEQHPGDRRPSSNSGNTPECREVGDVDDDGFLGDEDADKNSEGPESDMIEDRTEELKLDDTGC